MGVQDVGDFEFRAIVSSSSHSLGIRLEGVADFRVKEMLWAWLLGIHREALRLRVPQVTVDLRALEFMNSSCFKGFVNWLASLEDLEEDQRYRITLRSNPELHWQKRSLDALRNFAEDLVTIE
jgi:hypothetical protein